MTGIQPDTIRMRIKQNRASGQKIQTEHGEAWGMTARDIEEMQKLERGRLRLKKSGLAFPLLAPKVDAESEMQIKLIMTAKDEHIESLRGTVKKYENLLEAFQARTNVLDSERISLQDRINRLPAPPEILNEMLAAEKNQVAGLAEKVKELEEELQAERKKSWWSKLMGK